MKTYKVALALLFVLFYSVNLNAQYQKINSKGLDVFYRTFGQGKPILIIGGGPGDVSDRYLSLCELLSKDFKCILVDQRGTGKSMPAILDSTNISIDLTLADFEAIRNQLGITDWSVLGFSYGGFVASIYCSKYPESVSKLITLGSMGFDFSVFKYFNDNIISKLYPTDLDQLKIWSDSTRTSKNYKHAIVETIRAKMPGYFFDRDKALDMCKSIKYSDFDFIMGELIWNDIEKNYLKFGNVKSVFDKPVLIVQGRQDPLGESVAINLSNYYKKSKLVFVEKCGHYSWIEQPDIVLNTIIKFNK